MPRFKITIEYDGTNLAGWQKQNDYPSVQGYLEAAAQELTGKLTEVTAAGRTDAGVHAYSQVAHLDVESPLSSYNVMQGLNFHLLPLSKQIIVINAEEVAHNFHARFSASKRSYFYRIVNRRARLALDEYRAWHIPEKLDAEKMNEAAQILVGSYDFTTFRSTSCQAKSPFKTLERLDVIAHENEIHIYTHARSFLHHQVRNMVGSLRLIGNGKWNLPDLKSALEARDRRYGGETAPPQGLYLISVSY